MPGIGWLVVAVILAIILTAWVTFTLTRLDRLHARVDAAQAALDAQLVRRAAAVQHLADSARAELGPDASGQISGIAQHALTVDAADREPAENAVGKAANQLASRRVALEPDHAGELREVAEACIKAVIARRFYNDAVRDTRNLRTGRMPRLLRLAGHRDLPQFFDIDDATDWSVRIEPPGGKP
ncbi:MAG: uncharacterized protein JWM76_241 [Pseudonocardiales bacterium]|nr:uncharacterized protein [Pseudonocardiales bacterium]